MGSQDALAQLSRREREVAELIAEGLTDGAIASRLYISDRTVESHALQIRGKLRLANRAQIATWVTKAQLERDGQADRTAATPAEPPSLPVHLTRFIGREADLAKAGQLLQGTRLLTITGAGGCGKTRFAIQLAGELAHRYPAGAWFADLSAVRDPNLVPRHVASALGVGDPRGPDPIAALANQLRHGRRWRQGLVILDNCEHVRQTCAAVADTVLRTCPHLTVLCTSRTGLHVAGEAVWRLGPLSLPGAAASVSLEEAGQSEAVRLFLDRVGLSDPRFELTRENVCEVARLCHDLDGLPLALELAAARVGLLSVSQVFDHLGSRLLGQPVHGVPDRQQTLETTIGWSYGLLDEAEQRLLRLLSVFVGGFTSDAVEAVCGTTAAAGAPTTFELLTRLVDKSLVERLTHPAGRYRCLGLIGRFAQARLAETDDAGDVRMRHLEYFSHIAEQASEMLTGPRQPEWLARLVADHGNLRAALECSRGAPVERRLRFVLHLNRFWHVCGHVGEGREWTEAALDAAGDDVDAALRARALNAAGGLAGKQGDMDRARAHLEECLAIVTRLADRSGEQICLCMLGVIASTEGRWAESRRLYERSLALARELADARASGVVLSNLGQVMTCLGEHGSARRQLLEALEIMTGLGDGARQAVVLTNLGTASVYGGCDADAAGWYRKAIELMESVGSHQGLPECLDGLASIAARRGDHPRALRLAGAAAGIRGATGISQEAWARRLLDGWVTGSRAQVGPRSDAIWESGRDLSMRDAVALARCGE